jgi:hypothetical protein
LWGRRRPGRSQAPRNILLELPVIGFTAFAETRMGPIADPFAIIARALVVSVVVGTLRGITSANTAAFVD